MPHQNSAIHEFRMLPSLAAGQNPQLGQITHQTQFIMDLKRPMASFYELIVQLNGHNNINWINPVTMIVEEILLSGQGKYLQKDDHDDHHLVPGITFRFLSFKQFLPCAYSLLSEAKVETSIQNDCVNSLNNYSQNEEQPPNQK